MQSKDKIKDVFSSKLTDFKPQVPDAVWEKLEVKLSADLDVIKLAPTARSKWFGYVGIAASIAAAVLLCFVFFQSDKKEEANRLVENSVPKISHAPNIVRVDNEPIEEDIRSNKKTNLASNSQLLAAKQNSTSPQKDEPVNENLTVLKEDIAHALDENLPTQSADNQKKKELKNKEIYNLSNNLFANSEPEKKKKEKLYAIALGGGSTGFSNKENNNTLLESGNAMYLRSVAMLDLDENQLEDEPVKMDHKQPISFGLTVSKRISDKFSVETGLMYTYLSSKINSKKGSQLKRADVQQFHYLGIPLFVNYHFATFGKVDFYASAGGMVQKDVAGRLKGEAITRDLIFEKSEALKISQDHVQFSAMSRLGVSYPLYHKMRVFATAGGAYYFDAKNENPTIYSDRKLQLDLDAGIKFEF